MFVCYSSVLLFTASLPGRETFMFHYLIDSMSITPLSSHAGSSSVRTTGPMKLSSSRCELPFLYHTFCDLAGGDSKQHCFQGPIIPSSVTWSPELQIMFTFMFVKETSEVRAVIFHRIGQFWILTLQALLAMIYFSVTEYIVYM